MAPDPAPVHQGASRSGRRRACRAARAGRRACRPRGRCTRAPGTRRGRRRPGRR
ncbi:MAG: hypothetical protein MZV64_18395 [Ignavibacteriales bacterium]|nr:hypothetical protein [Ignavibacteriales bacterium]